MWATDVGHQISGSRHHTPGTDLNGLNGNVRYFPADFFLCLDVPCGEDEPPVAIVSEKVELRL